VDQSTGDRREAARLSSSLDCEREARRNINIGLKDGGHDGQDGIREILRTGLEKYTERRLVNNLSL
jgi:hypothetical protein